MSDLGESRMSEGYQAAAVLDLHAKRSLSGDGYTNHWCVECRQDWPCATLRAMGYGR